MGPEVPVGKAGRPFILVGRQATWLSPLSIAWLDGIEGMSFCPRGSTPLPNPPNRPPGPRYASRSQALAAGSALMARGKLLVGGCGCSVGRKSANQLGDAVPQIEGAQPNNRLQLH